MENKQSYNGKINTNFHDNKIPKEGSQFLCLLVILIDSVLRTGKHYYPRVVLEECKYVGNENKIPKYIIDDIEISSDSDEENSDKEILKIIQTKKILRKKILVKKLFSTYLKNGK